MEGLYHAWGRDAMINLLWVYIKGKVDAKESLIYLEKEISKKQND